MTRLIIVDLSELLLDLVENLRGFSTLNYVFNYKKSTATGHGAPVRQSKGKY